MMGVTPLAAKSETVDASGAESPFDGEGFPGGVVFAFGKAEGVFARVAEHGAINATGDAAADVADDELKGASDGRVGAVALPERIDPRIHADFACDRSVDDDHGSGKECGGEQSVHAKGLCECGFNRCEYDGQSIRVCIRQGQR